jgi:hypothetical protein
MLPTKIPNEALAEPSQGNPEKEPLPLGSIVPTVLGLAMRGSPERHAIVFWAATSAVAEGSLDQASFILEAERAWIWDRVHTTIRHFLKSSC